MPSCQADARGLYHSAAREAEDALAMRLGEEGLQLALEAATWKARFAAYLNGDEYDAPRVPARASDTTAPAAEPPKPTVPLLGTTELAKLHRMSDRNARKRIANRFYEGVPGFHRGKRGWLAEPDAFASSA